MATRKQNIPPVEEPVEEIKEQEAAPAEEKDSTIAQKDAEIAALKAQIEAMTARKNGGKESDYDRIHRIEKEAEEAGLDMWGIEVEVLVPHREKTEDPWYWIQVNNLSVQIPANDRYQAMKLPFACVLVDLLMYERHSIDYQDSLEVFDPVENPHRD